MSAPPSPPSDARLEVRPHAPVLLAEVVQALEPAPGRRIIDATFGAGGYSLALLEAGARVAAVDRDPGALPFAEAAAKAFPGRFRFLAGRFSDLESLLETDAEAENGAPVGWNGIVFDLGVSSMQLDQAERGFSFMRDGPLDMRMDRSGSTAADLVNETDEEELARILWVYGEERASRRVARAIVRRRAEQAFTATLDLAAVVERALGGRRGAPTHPATRTFQALRLAVNEELAELEAGLDAAERVLGEGGRLAVVTFHSLEDRLVKSFLTERSGRTPQVSRHRPPAEDPRRASFTLLFNGARVPGAAEVAVNPRSRSAKLRAGVRTDAPAWRRAA